MSGFAMVMAACILCGKPFSFNPHKVPSLKVNGHREPVCLSCHTTANNEREAAGVERWPEPMPGAYEPMPAEEL